MGHTDKQWNVYMQILRWLEAKYRKGEIEESLYLSHIKLTNYKMQKMVIDTGIFLN